MNTNGKQELRNHAFLTSEGLEYRDGENWRVEPFKIKRGESLDSILTRLYRNNRVVWIRDEKVFKAVLKRFDEPITNFIEWRKADGNEKMKTYRNEAARGEFYLRAPKALDDWRIGDQSSEAIERAFTRFQDTFRRSIFFSPGRTGLHVLEKICGDARKGDVLNMPRTSFHQTPFAENWPDLHWARDLTEGETARAFIHAYDKNHAYVSSANIKLGIGDYAREMNPAFHDVPGVWRVEVMDTGDAMLWDITRGREWLHTPSVKLLRDLNINHAIREAYIFEKSNPVMTQWYEDFAREFKAIDPTSDDDRIYRKLLKVVSLNAIGWLGSEEWARDWMYRPDWHNAIITDAQARMMRNAAKVRELTGQAPFKCEVDCLYYVSDEENHIKAFPFLTDVNLSRAYKHAGTWRMDSDEGQRIAGLIEGA